MDAEGKGAERTDATGPDAGGPDPAGIGDVKKAMDEFRAPGHHLVDLLADYLASAEQRPLFPAAEPRSTQLNPVNFRTRREHMDELFALLAAECGRAHADEAAQGGG